MNPDASVSAHLAAFHTWAVWSILMEPCCVLRDITVHSNSGVDQIAKVWSTWKWGSRSAPNGAYSGTVHFRCEPDLTQQTGMSVHPTLHSNCCNLPVEAFSIKVWVWNNLVFSHVQFQFCPVEVHVSHLVYPVYLSFCVYLIWPFFLYVCVFVLPGWLACSSFRLFTY